LESKESAPIRQKMKLDPILLRPNIGISELREALPDLHAFLHQYEEEFVQLAEINMKYEGYIQREQEMVDKVSRLDEVRLLESFDYSKINSLSAEAREKLNKMKPRTIGQASRISGITPADVSVLLVHLGR
jgi:tRNA uridine 5-carboxymethylaminomethyl modification enzyme